MKAGDIWAGHEYAVLLNRDRGRGEFALDATRCKVIRMRKMHKSGNERSTTVVEVVPWNPPINTWSAKAVEREIRQVIDFWDDYIGNVRHTVEEAKERIRTSIARNREHTRKEQAIRTIVESKMPGVVINSLTAYNITLTVESLMTHLAADLERTASLLVIKEPTEDEVIAQLPWRIQRAAQNL